MNNCVLWYLIIIHTKLGLLTNKKERLRKKRKTKNQLFWWDFGRKGQVGWEMKSQQEEEEKWVQSLWWSCDKFNFFNYPREPLRGGGGVSHTPDLIPLCCREGASDEVEEGMIRTSNLIVWRICGMGMSTLVLQGLIWIMSAQVYTRYADPVVFVKLGVLG
jgi:hypothetical protein